MTRVVIVATPVSGRDIDRLAAGASVYGNAEKAAMVHQLLTR
jgi:predicted polyphosphate/ATP-dependent NAD kinase